jgi:hypothetical protein
MRQTKYLFDESKMTADGCVSVSQLQTFLSCRKKWEYNYIEGLKPRVERSYLTVGKLCHKGMQVAMQSAWKDQKSGLCEDYYTTGRWKSWNDAGIVAMNKEWVHYMESVPLLDEEIPDVEQMHYDAVSVFTQAFEEFEPWKYEVITLCDKGHPIPALELHFKVPCPPTKGLHGYIDAILRDRETGFVWCTDYKFRKSLSPDEDEAFNIQNAVYSYACQKMGVEITGTMTWQHVNTPAADPAILKDGKISRSKTKTTWTHYAQFCIDHGQDPENYYLEMEEKLRDIEWRRATLEYRNPETINRIWKECVVPVAKQVKAAHGKKADNFCSLYPWNCKMCQYQSLCQAELRDYDADAIREREYTKR